MDFVGKYRMSLSLHKVPLVWDSFWTPLHRAFTFQKKGLVLQGGSEFVFRAKMREFLKQFTASQKKLSNLIKQIKTMKRLMHKCLVFFLFQVELSAKEYFTSCKVQDFGFRALSSNSLEKVGFTSCHWKNLLEEDKEENWHLFLHPSSLSLQFCTE